MQLGNEAYLEGRYTIKFCGDRDWHQKYTPSSLYSRHFYLRLLLVPQAEGELQGKSFGRHLKYEIKNPDYDVHHV